MSFRMSKDVAHQIAIKLTEKKQKAVDKLKKEYELFVTNEYWKQTPRSVKLAFKKFPEYFRTDSSVVLNGHGFNWEYVSTTKRVIEKKDGRSFLTLTPELSSECMKLMRAWQKEQEAIKLLKGEIETALFGLRSVTQIQKHLPEAIPYLPKETSMELMINLDDLRTKIKAA